MIKQIPIVISKYMGVGSASDLSIKSIGRDVATCLVSRDCKGICRDNANAILVCNMKEDFLRIKEATEQGYAIAREGDGVNVGAIGSHTRRGRVGGQVANTLTCVNEMGVVVKAVLTPDRAEKRQNGRRIKDDGEPMFTLTTQDRHGILIETPEQPELRIRKLTPRECWRLQGFPDECFDKAAKVVSDTQLYKQAGNAVTVNVAKIIGMKLKEIEDGEC